MEVSKLNRFINNLKNRLVGSNWTQREVDNHDLTYGLLELAKIVDEQRYEIDSLRRDLLGKKDIGS